MTTWTRAIVCYGLAFLGNPVAGQEPKKEYAKEFHQSLKAQPQLKERIEFQFRDGIAKQPMLRLFGAGVEPLAAIQPEGLLFKVPAGRNNPGEVGVEARQRLRGDFEITLEYELLTLPNPPPKLGAGAGLQILLDTPDDFKARMGRSNRPTGPVFTANYITLGSDGKEVFKGLTAPPANDKETKGRLRMVRTGKMLSYQVQEGGSGFRAIANKEIGLADVIAAQALVATGWEPVALEARFPRLELRAGEFPAPTAQQQQPKQPDLPAGGFHQDFRQQPELLPPLTFFGPDPMEVARFEKEGLRVIFPAIRKHPDRVGVQLTERIKGDFEITAAYEILKGGRPTEGSGVGVELFVATDSATREELGVFRVARVNEGEVHMTSRVTIEGGKPRYHVSQHFPTECKSGRLKITRVGSEVTLWAAEGNAKDFQELRREDLGPEDVTLVRLNAYPGHKQNELDVRIIDLRVRGLRPNEASAIPVPIEASKRESGKGGLAVAMAAGIAIPLLAAIALGAVLYLRRRKVPAATNPSAAFVSIACPDCGQKLKVKTALAGKKVKCGQSGKTVLVEKEA